MADLVPQIYHEKQDPGSMLCAQHALNNLLQSSLFTPQDLADIARRLDQLEQDQLDNDDGAGESHNYDDSGFFSIMVMEEALKVLGLRLVRWKSKEMVDFHDKPESMEGFVLNHQLHWYTIRRFGTETRWYNLDSCIPSATWISPMYLGLTLREAELQGYSILAVLPTDDALITGLPACPATTLALTLPAPSSTTSSYSRSSGASTNPFQGKGNTLGSSSTSSSSKPSTSSSSSSTLPKPTRTTSKRRQDSPSPTRSGSASASGSGSSVEEESEKRRRRPRLDVDEDMDGTGGGGEEMSEEDQMALAIAESMKASSLEDLGDGGTNGEEKKEEKVGRSRAERDEDDELKAALKASLEESSGGGAGEKEKGKEKEKEKEVEEEGEDDSPSVEELRRRRLARFG